MARYLTGREKSFRQKSFIRTESATTRFIPIPFLVDRRQNSLLPFCLRSPIKPLTQMHRFTCILLARMMHSHHDGTSMCRPETHGMMYFRADQLATLYRHIAQFKRFIQIILKAFRVGIQCLYQFN